MGDVETAARLVSNVGFPVAVAVVLLYQVIKMHKDSNRICQDLSEEIRRMRTAVESLTSLLLHASRLNLTIHE